MLMKDLLTELAGKGGRDGIQTGIVFNDGIGMLHGALRFFQDDTGKVRDGLFQLLVPQKAQLDPQQPPKMVIVSHVFTVESVGHIFAVADQPKPEIVTPRGGLVIPNS